MRGAVAGLTLLLAACAPPVTVRLPEGGGRPDPAALSYLQDATRHCERVQSMTAELALAGRVRGRALRGRVLSGSTARGELRLEGVAPFGAPIFVLAASGGRASLLLPREGRVVEEVPTAELLDAVSGIALSSGDLHSVLAGCAVADRTPQNARVYEGGWAALDVGTGRTVFLKRGRAGWRIEAARVDGITVGYGMFEGVSPREIRLVASGQTAASVELRLRLAQVEENVPIAAEAFVLDVPTGTRPMPIAELRDQGLLGSAGGK